ncbi:MAG: PBECR4 domain-containing protein [Ruminococcus sp.]|nr:PBECR4 domain-containing protein [Ruminococcus sp.]MCM1380690.1 PBECR4 domain-containing protein [Muribaculaceae bacterium]MCM1479994.1 PBECR4 domain-containing protein [Muribaculaceae bacterium]
MAGLQYLTDIRELKSDREKIFNKIEYDNNFVSLILNSENYFKIAERVNFVTVLENFLDSNKTVFKFNNRTNILSLIDADYILKNSDTAKNMYVFISMKGKNSDTYFCRSAFPRDKSEPDYAAGHTAYTLLYKEKIDLLANEKQILYVNPSYRER